MTQDLAYDIMLEVQGLIRSLAVRTTLDREFRAGETFRLHDFDWVVERVDAVTEEHVDRRLVARELVSNLNPIAV